ncbi:MAG: prepilin-type N-terminal cleavage/methylation domain-containing protein [Candidatus Omnitrophota bacterium]|nr:MAG: prepilin-type N-terminal cleavage/methylation domain-containing protein [Candidatus Omnitrophota bacterium]
MKKTGLTFLELMLTLTIFAVVAVTVYSTFGTGLSAWRRAQKTQQLYQDVRMGLNRIACDLENAVFYSEKEDFPNFAGTGSKVSFYSLMDDYRIIPVHPELRKITYSLDESTQILQRLEQTLPLPEEGEEVEAEAQEALAEKVAALKFFYCYEDKEDNESYKWLDTWNNTEEIPQGIRIELALEEAGEVPFTKYVFIPIGEKGQEK